jgi:hypothetical protein
VLLLAGRIYKLRHSDCLWWHVILTKFREDRYRHLKVVRERYRQTNTYTQQGYLIRLFLFLSKEGKCVKNTFE